MVFFAPATTNVLNIPQTKEWKRKFSKTFKNTCEIEKKLYSLHRFERHCRHCGNERKQEEHVPRHIELTAVLREILRQRIESNRIEDLNKPLDLQSKNK
jgi:hypothetical protein